MSRSRRDRATRAPQGAIFRTWSPSATIISGTAPQRARARAGEGATLVAQLGA
jgi:hypothetical protein